MAKKKQLIFKPDEQLAIKGAMFQVIKLKNGNMMVRALGGYDMEGDAMVLRQPVLETKPSKSQDIIEE